MKKSIIRLISILCIVAVMISMTFTTVIAATIYYYFGYLYTYLNNDMVSLYGVEEGTDYLFIRDTLNSRRLVDIRNSAFMDNTEITAIDFAGAANLERIGSFAFKGCTSITRPFSLPNSINKIETGAFQECSSLESVEINVSADTIPNQCFYQCSSLTSVTIGESIRTIGNYAFADCPALEYLEIPATVTSIADTAFLNDDITLGVYYNSAAYQYALNNSIEYIVLDPENLPTEPPTEPEPTEALPTEPEPTESVPTEAESTEPEPTEALNGYYLGDVNNNRIIEIFDVTLIQRKLASLSYPEGCIFEQGDVNADNITDIVDVSLIQRYLAKLMVNYPIGEWVNK